MDTADHLTTSVCMSNMQKSEVLHNDAYVVCGYIYKWVVADVIGLSVCVGLVHST